MKLHPRLRGASAKRVAEAMALFDIVNLKRRQASSARILRARLRRRRGSALACVRFGGRGRSCPRASRCAHVIAHARQHEPGVLSAGGPFWSNEPTLQKRNKYRTGMSGDIVDRPTPCYFSCYLQGLIVLYT
jgi:hypothetical protein